MPKHPVSPPFKSSLVVSKSKETEKHMTTIPKPIAYSKWKSWQMKLLDKNVLRWFPTGYENLLEHLFSKLKEITETILVNMTQKERKLAFIHYNPKMDINDLKAWNIELIDQIEGVSFSDWSWKYDPPESRYLLYPIRKELHERLTSSEGLMDVRGIMNTTIGIMLANSYKLMNQ